MRQRLIPALIATLSILAATIPSVSAQTSCSQTLQSLVDNAASGATVLVPACTYHENVWIGKPITLDGQNAATITGDNTRDRWVQIYSSGVTIRNFTMVDANPALQEGAICTCLAGATGIVIDHNNLGATVNGKDIAIGSTVNAKITNNQIHAAGEEGIGSYLDTGLVIQGNHIYGNNTANVDPTWDAGGIKAFTDTNLQIVGNEVDHNAGPGIWCDGQCQNVTIASNKVHDQAYNPIFYEVSSHADIHDNTVSASNTNPAGDNWGCIASSSSGDVNIHDNTCTDTLPLRAQLDNRPDLSAVPDVGHNNVLQNNTLVRPVPPQATSWWQWSPTGPLIPGQNGNVDSGNVVRGSLTPTPLTNTPAPLPTTTPTISCQVEIWLNGVDQGKKAC